MTYGVGGVGGLDARAVKQEAHGAEALALALAERSHQLLKLSRALDLEEDLVVVVGDLDVEVLGTGGGGFLLGHCVGRGNLKR